MSLMLLSALSALSAAQAGEVVIRLDGVQVDGAPLVLRVFATEKTYPDFGEEVRILTVPASSATIEMRVRDLAPGRYGFTVHHDHDADGELDFSVLPPGPAEGTAASCVKKPVMVPRWSNCSVEVPAGGTELRLAMWY